MNYFLQAHCRGITFNLIAHSAMKNDVFHSSFLGPVLSLIGHVDEGHIVLVCKNDIDQHHCL
jgi:hypothetical protein